jgi:hypothetical protein
MEALHYRDARLRADQPTRYPISLAEVRVLRRSSDRRRCLWGLRVQRSRIRANLVQLRVGPPDTSGFQTTERGRYGPGGSGLVRSGASSGPARALTQAVIASGERAVVTTRRRGALAALAAIDDARVLAVPLDVADAVARKAALVAALARFGRIDVLANIAGRGSLGAVEELASEQ